VTRPFLLYSNQVIANQLSNRSNSDPFTVYSNPNILTNMYCIAYLACILAAAGLCSAVDVEPRGEMRYTQPVSHLKEAASPSYAHNLPRGYMGGGEGSGSSSSGGGFLGGANTVVDTWTAEKIVVVATADHAALMKAHPAADADGVECLATAQLAIPLSKSGSSGDRPSREWQAFTFLAAKPSVVALAT